jgi:hypothetical protein
MVRQAHHPEQRRRVNSKFQKSMFKTFVRRRRIEFWSLRFVWDLNFGICDLNNSILEKEVILNQSKFNKLLIGHGTHI